MQEKIKGFIQLIVVLVIVAGAFGIAGYLASLREVPRQGSEAGEKVLRVETRDIQAAPHTIKFRTTGTVSVRAMVEIVPQVSGKIIEIDENSFTGGTFTADQPLFRIEPEDFELEVKRLRAEVARARTRLALQEARSEAAIEEWQGIHGTDKTPPPLVAQKPQLEEARAALDGAKAQLGVAKLNLQRTRFSLPYEGRIQEAGLERGQFLRAGQSYGRAYALDALEIEVPVTDQQLAWILAGQDPQILIEADIPGDDRKFEGRLKRVSADVDSTTRFARVFVEVVDPGRHIVPGVFTHISFTGPRRERMWRLPTSALKEDNIIWIVDDQDRLQKLRPEIIHITGDHVIARADREQIEVVTSPVSGVTGGTRVRSGDQ